LIYLSGVLWKIEFGLLRKPSHTIRYIAVYFVRETGSMQNFRVDLGRSKVGEDIVERSGDERQAFLKRGG
jgi:hypothetical protein